MKTISCYILDDEKEARERMAILLGKMDEVKIIGIEGDPATAVEEIISKKPELVFTDIEMPKKSGFDVVRGIRGKGYCPQVVFVTGYSQYAIKAIKETAFDYLVKPVDIDELRETINRYLTTEFKRPSSSFQIENLSEREKETIRLIAKCLTSQEIADKLHISKTTVDTHRRNILEKTGFSSTQELVIHVVENGIV